MGGYSENVVITEEERPSGGIMSPPFHLYSPPADAGLPSLRGSKTPAHKSTFKSQLDERLRNEITKLGTRIIKNRLIQVACLDDSSS